MAWRLLMFSPLITTPFLSPPGPHHTCPGLCVSTAAGLPGPLSSSVSHLGHFTAPGPLANPDFSPLPLNFTQFLRPQPQGSVLNSHIGGFHEAGLQVWMSLCVYPPMLTLGLALWLCFGQWDIKKHEAETQQAPAHWALSSQKPATPGKTVS